MFDKKNNLLQDGDFIVIQTRVANLELAINEMKTHLNSLRGLVNRKLEGYKPHIDTNPSNETYKSRDGLDSLR